MRATAGGGDGTGDEGRGAIGSDARGATGSDENVGGGAGRGVTPGEIDALDVSGDDGAGDVDAAGRGAVADAGVDDCAAGTSTRSDVDGGADGDGAAALREAVLGAAVFEGVAAGNDRAGDEVVGRDARGVAAVPRAAGIDDDGRGTDDEAVRGAAACFGGGDGASIAITADSVTNPIATAASP